MHARAALRQPVDALIKRLRGASELRLALAAVALALVLIAALFVYSRAARPRLLALSEVGEDDVGLLVEVEGLVRSARALSNSALRITLVDRGASLAVFVPDAPAGSVDPSLLAPGARLAVVGEVAGAAGGVEIDASGPSALRLVAPAGSESVAIGALLDAPEHYGGLAVRVEGTLGAVKSSRGDLTILAADPAGGVAARILIVAKGDPKESFSYRDRLEVAGSFGYGYESGPGWRITVEAADHEVTKGSVTPGPGARQVGLGELMGAPESYEGSEVVVRGLTVIDATDVAGTSTELASGADHLSLFIARSEWTRTDVIPGDEVSAVGHLEYYRPRGAWEFVLDSADAITRAAYFG
jgi:hypothetical protein